MMAFPDVAMEVQQPESSAADVLEQLQKLEQRVTAIAEELRDARKARRAAEAEANSLREQCHNHELEIVLLKKKLEGDDLRTTVRTRVESLLRRIDELEEEG